MFCTKECVEKKKRKKKTGVENYQVTGRPPLKLGHLNMRFDTIKSHDY